MKNIRNFSIIAHVNHGKSTLSDRIIQICNGLTDHEIKNQILDSMILERERGITIKAQSVMLNYQALDAKTYKLNLIDTPGHIDFSYEVSRSLAASEGVLLVVDARQGVEAQTIANYYIAIEMNLKIIPVLNKIDLPNVYPERVAKEIEDILGLETFDILCCSAKTGVGILDLLERLVKDIPHPKGNPDAPLQALIIDSWFDNYLGIVSLVRIKNGTLRKGDKIKIMSTGHIYNADRMGVFLPKQNSCNELKCGEVGWLVCSIKDIFGAPVGDTITSANNSAHKALPGFKKIKPQVYAGLFPTNSKEYKPFCAALNKLSLNDASLLYEPESSITLGLGFRCGFLGLLHMEIIYERLKREYNLDIIITAPNVIYEIKMNNNKIIYIDNPSKLPPINNIKELREPIAECRIMLPKEHLGSVITLCIKKRGIQTDMIYHNRYVAITYEIPMTEVIFNFFDRLKSISHGYASLDYKFKYFKTSKLVCVNVLINGERIDTLTFITHKKDAYYRSKELVKNIKDLIPHQQFEITIQATIGSQIIARSTVKQLRKNVIAKCYGGDISRKKKLLQKQQEGKKRMKQIGKINIPQETFLAILHINNKY